MPSFNIEHRSQFPEILLEFCYNGWSGRRVGNFISLLGGLGVNNVWTGGTHDLELNIFVGGGIIIFFFVMWFITPF